MNTQKQQQLANDIYSSGDGTKENADLQASNYAELLDYLGPRRIAESGGENEVWVWFVNSPKSLSRNFNPKKFCGDK